MDDNVQPITPQMPLSDGQMSTDDQTQPVQPTPIVPVVEEPVIGADETPAVELLDEEEDDSFTADASPSGPAA